MTHGEWRNANRSWVNGGNSTGEHFNDPHRFAEARSGIAITLRIPVGAASCGVLDCRIVRL